MRLTKIDTSEKARPRFITLNEYNILSANNKIVSAEHELKEDKRLKITRYYDVNPEDNQHDSPKQEKQEDDKI